MSLAASVTESLTARWNGLAANVRGAVLVTVGALLLVVMAVFVKMLGKRLDSFQILFFRSFVGLLFILPLAFRYGLDICRTRYPFKHLTRGGVGILGNFCFFYSITHLLLADAMALQFSRPLFMIVLAALFLGERAGWARGLATVVGFAGVVFITRPFSTGFEPAAVIGALGALFGALVVVAIKQLSKTESTTVIMFYYAFWGAVFSLPAALWVWKTPTWPELGLLVIVGFLGILGQSGITRGVSIAETTFVLPFDYLRIVYAGIFGILLFNEIPDAWSIGGTAVIVVSTYYILRAEARAKARAAKPPAGA
jgi:drug/metabolite transporter (DMT)-like permease